MGRWQADERRGYGTPEEAALSTYSPAAEAVVVSVERRGPHTAKVTVRAGPSGSGYETYWVDCALHDDGLWYDEGGGG